MASQDVEYYAGTDEVLYVQVDNIDLVDSTGAPTTKTVTAELTKDEVTTTISSGLTVTQTGDPSIFKIDPNATLKALSSGLYAVTYIYTDSNGDVTKSGPNFKFFIK